MLLSKRKQDVVAGFGWAELLFAARRNRSPLSSPQHADGTNPLRVTDPVIRNASDPVEYLRKQKLENQRHSVTDRQAKVSRPPDYVDENLKNAVTPRNDSASPAPASRPPAPARSGPAPSPQSLVPGNQSPDETNPLRVTDPVIPNASDPVDYLRKQKLENQRHTGTQRQAQLSHPPDYVDENLKNAVTPRDASPAPGSWPPGPDPPPA